MWIQQINLNLLRVFQVAYRTQSMTVAASELHLTQSGVSQHIRHLEEFLEKPLFERSRLKLIPTEAAHQLYLATQSAFDPIEAVLEKLKGGKTEIQGLVQIGVPVEFGNNIVAPLLAELGKKIPGLRFHIRYGMLGNLEPLLLSGDLDFAFMDTGRVDRRIQLTPVFDEILELCASETYLKAKGLVSSKESKKFFESLDYADYQVSDPIVKLWFEHHFKESHWAVPIRATAIEATGIFRFIQAGFLAGILPSYVLTRLLGQSKEKVAKIRVFKGCGSPLKNTISIGYLKDRSRNEAVQTVIDSLMKNLIQ